MQKHTWNEREHGAFSEEALREKFRSEGYSVSTLTYRPGRRFSAHTHRVDKVDAVLEGRFRIEMGGELVVLERGEWVYVPAGREHAAEVVGDEPVVSLDGARR